MDHSTTLARPLPPDLHAPALRILRRLLAGIERPPALRLGDAILHELETHPEYTLVIRDPGLLRSQFSVWTEGREWLGSSLRWGWTRRRCRR